MKILLDENKNFYKANLHCHSTLSDGKMSVRKLKSEFKKRGYSILAFTDHEHIIDNSELNDDEFLAITSCEISIKQFPKQSTILNRNMKVCHLNFYAIEPHNDITPCYSVMADHFINEENKNRIKYENDYEREYSAECINEIIKKANNSGFLVAYNHPVWSLENARDYLNYEGLFAVEIFNNNCIKGGIPEYSVNVFDDFLRDGKRIFCTMCDDCHEDADINSPDFDAFGGFVMVNSEKLDYSSVITALKNGDFYSSNGPLIYSLSVEGKKVKIKCSNAKQIAYTTFGRRAKAFNAKSGEILNFAEFSINDNDVYFRITVTDANGNHAHTQGYFLKDLF